MDDAPRALRIAHAATPATFELAEGVIWDDRAQLVRWVDIWKGRVLAGTLHGERIEQCGEVAIGQTAGAVGLAEDGGLVVAAARGLATVSPSGAVRIGPDLLGAKREVRLNDGSVDPFGAFVVGTMALGEPGHDEVLLRVHPDGQVETIREGIGLSNGIAFTPDGRTIYHVDTLARTVSSHSYDADTFNNSEPWIVVLEGFSHYPDGLIADADGALWVAFWGGSRVARYATSGELLDTVHVNAAQASAMGLVGEALDTLVITTAQQGLDVLDDEAGALFIAPASTAGLPTPRWQGSTNEPYWVQDASREREVDS